MPLSMSAIRNTFRILKNGRVSMVLTAMLSSGVFMPIEGVAAPRKAVA